MNGTSATPPSPRFLLRDLTFPTRLVLTAFLLSVGIGYVSAIVNLHLQEASPGELLPNRADVITVYHGKTDVTQLERLLTVHESHPFNGQGSMRAAFTRTKGGGIDQAITRLAEARKLDPDDLLVRANLEGVVLDKMDGERQALVAWAIAGCPRDAYDNNSFPLLGSLKDMPVTDKFVNANADGKRFVKIQSILTSRCVRCHSSKEEGPASQYSLASYKDVAAYGHKPAPSGKSLTKLALTTHVHLLGFSMLYGLTGLILAFSRWPFLIRLLVCPLPLIAQVFDITCWWLARLDGHTGEMFASIIPISGGVVALGLVAQIVLSVFDMYGWTGRFILVLLFVGAGAGGGFLVHKVVQPYLDSEKTRAMDRPATNAANTPTTTKKPDDHKVVGKPDGDKNAKAEPSHMEKLITDEPSNPAKKEFNGKGSMSKAFINEKWDKAKAKYEKEHGKLKPEDADAALYAERDGERLALLAWLQAGAPHQDYEKDAFLLPAKLIDHPITSDFREGKSAKIKSILVHRCVRCHGPDGDKSEFPLDTYAAMKIYLPKKVGGKPPVAVPEGPVKKVGDISVWGMTFPTGGEEKPVGPQPDAVVPKPKVPARRRRRQPAR